MSGQSNIDSLKRQSPSFQRGYNFNRNQEIEKQIILLSIEKERIEIELKTLRKLLIPTRERKQPKPFYPLTPNLTPLPRTQESQRCSSENEIHKRRLLSKPDVPHSQYSDALRRPKLKRNKIFPINETTAKIYCNSTCPKEIKSGIQDYFDNKLKLTNQIDSNTDRCNDKHVFLICCERSRQVPAVEEVVKNLSPHITKKYCVLYLRHREIHTLNNDTSLNTNAVFKCDPYLRRFGSVIDCVYDKRFEIYDCEVNTKAEHLIRAFLIEKENMGSSPSRHETGLMGSSPRNHETEKNTQLDPETASD